MQTVTAWDTQESGAGEQSGVVMVDGIKTGNATSTATDEAGAGGRHREMHGVRERAAGRQEQEWGARGGGREAYGVADESPRVRGEEGGRDAYGVAENPGGDR